MSQKIEYFFSDSNETVQENNTSHLVPLKTNFWYLDTNMKNIFDNYDFNSINRLLCVGNVQSGKTNNIINIIKNLINFGVDIIVVFGGTTKLLVKQCHDRIVSELVKSNLNHKFEILGRDYISSIKSFVENDGQKGIFVIMKQKSDFDEVLNSLNILNLSNKNIVFIDDECDFGSINTNKLLDPSYFHDRLEKLFNRVHKGGLISFTATPFANILNEKNINNDCNKNTKIIKLFNSEQYTGLKEFNRANTYVRLFDGFNEGDETKMTDNEKIGKAIFVYFISIAAKAIDNEKSFESFNSEMLINIYNEIQEQATNWNDVVEFLKNLKWKWNDITIKNAILFTINSLNLDKFKKYINNQQFYEVFKQIIEYFTKVDNSKNIFILNGTEKEKDNIEIFLDENVKHKIIIGGNMLSRGVTFPNLLTELILNYPKEIITVDVMLQRCRWFGYRNKNMPYISIITSQKLIDFFHEIEQYLNVLENTNLSLEEIKKEIKILDEKNKSKGYRSTSTMKG